MNVGERLYQKGMKLKEEVMQKIENQKLENKKKNAKIYTYKPVTLNVVGDDLGVIITILILIY